MAKVIQLRGVNETLLRWRRAIRHSDAAGIREYDKVIGVQSIAGNAYASTLTNTPENIAKFIAASRHNKLIMTKDRTALITTIGRTLDCWIDDREYMAELQEALELISSTGAAPNYFAEDFKRIENLF